MFSIPIIVLIIFFAILLISQLLFKNKIIEGLETDPSYNDYNTSSNENALILAQQNAGNIAYLKQQFDSLQSFSQQFQDLSGNVQTLQTQVNGLVQSQQDYANQMTGGTAPNITGTTDDTTDDTTTDDTTTTNTTS